MNFGEILQADGLSGDERDDVKRLLSLMSDRRPKNELRRRYYEGHQPLKNLGIAVPKSYEGLDVACSWGSKAVDVLAARSRFEGFAFEEEPLGTRLHAMAKANRLAAKYGMALTDELTHCCTFATLDASERMGARVMFHSAETAAALWDGAEGRIRCGIALAATRPAEGSYEERPSQVNYYSADAVVEISRVGGSDRWEAVRKPHILGRPMMVRMAYRPTERSPFGTSRISRHVRAIVDEYMRVQLRKSMASEVATIVQKYILGATEDDFDQTQYDAAIGHILLFGRDQDGLLPTVGQFSAAPMSPHLEQERSLAGAFASATSVPMSALIADYANPMSADAVYATNEPLVIEAERLNAANGEAMAEIAMMMMAIERGVPFDGLSDEERTVYAKWANPAAPSIASMADAAVKINSAAPWYSETPQFWDDLGKSRQERDTLLAQRRAIEARAMVSAQRQEAAARAASGGLDDSANFYRVTSVAKDYGRGALTRPVAERMLQSLGVGAQDASALLDAQDGDPATVEVPGEIADGQEQE